MAGFKKGYARKRAPSEDDDHTGPAAKRAKEDEDSEIVIPKLETDEEGSKFISLKDNGLRRVSITSFQGKMFVNIREYWKDKGGDAKPGKKGIMLTIGQYNTMLAAAPLLENALKEKGQSTVRPQYDGEPAKAEDGDSEDEKEEKEDNEDEDDEEEEEE